VLANRIIPKIEEYQEFFTAFHGVMHQLMLLLGKLSTAFLRFVQSKLRRVFAVHFTVRGLLVYDIHHNILISAKFFH